MHVLHLRLGWFFADENGATAVEYAVMLALIIVVCLVAIAAIGTNSNANFNSPKLVNALQSGS